jgi:hypothetical protein
MKLDKILDFLADAAVIGAAGYVVYQSVKAMDEWIDTMCEEIKWESTFNETVKNLATTVLSMNQERWDFFYSRISPKASYDKNARYLLHVASSTLNSLEEIDQLSQYSTDEAMGIMIDVLHSKDRGELQAFIYALDYKSKNNIRVKALQSRLYRQLS